MAENDFIRFDINKNDLGKVKGVITLYDQNMTIALNNAINTAAGAGAQVLAKRIRTATTKTGRAGIPRGRVGPGRRRTDEMYQSVVDEQFKEFHDVYVRQTKGSTIRVRFGFLGGPAYTKFQEEGTKPRAAPTRLHEVGLSDYKVIRVPLSRQKKGTKKQFQQGHPGIPPMHAFQLGWNTVGKVLFTELAAQAQAAGNAAQAQRYLRRAKVRKID
jgi:hypothetical protein